MNGHEKIKQAIVNARCADATLCNKQLALDEAKVRARDSWKEVERILKAVLGDRAKHGVILEGALYRLTEEGLRCTSMEAEVIT
jgi:hypothetical protein